jgi:hypothetical protein
MNARVATEGNGNFSKIAKQTSSKHIFNSRG